MSMFKALKVGTTTNPKTILGFFATVIAILVAGAVGSMVAIEGPVLVVVLIVMGALVIGIIAVVIVALWKDPSRLLLGEVTAQDYLAIQQVTLGDDSLGEYTQSRTPVQLMPGHEQLPAGPDLEDESK